MKYKILLLFIVAAFAFYGCQQKDDLKEDTYQAGIIITDNILNTYLQVQNIAFKNQYMQNMADILINNKDTVKFAPVLKGSDNLYLFVLYKDLLSSYEQSVEPTNRVSNDELNKKALTILIEIDSLHLFDEERTKDLKAYINSMKNDNFYVLAEITKLLSEVYKYDVESWRHDLDSSYNTFAIKVSKIPNTVFDPDKLAKYVYEPYKDPDKLAEIYKLNLKQDAFEFKTKFNDNAARNYLALKDFEEVLAEFMKRNPDYSFIYYKIQLIGNFSGKKINESAN